MNSKQPQQPARQGRHNRRLEKLLSQIARSVANIEDHLVVGDDGRPIELTVVLEEPSEAPDRLRDNDPFPKPKNWMDNIHTRHSDDEDEA